MPSMNGYSVPSSPVQPPRKPARNAASCAASNSSRSTPAVRVGVGAPGPMIDVDEDLAGRPAAWIDPHHRVGTFGDEPDDAGADDDAVVGVNDPRQFEPRRLAGLRKVVAKRVTPNSSSSESPRYPREIATATPSTTASGATVSVERTSVPVSTSSSCNAVGSAANRPTGGTPAGCRLSSPYPQIHTDHRRRTAIRPYPAARREPPAARPKRRVPALLGS